MPRLALQIGGMAPINCAFHHGAAIAIPWCVVASSEITMMGFAAL